MRRKVFAVVVLLTAVFLFLFWLANHYVFRQLDQITPPADVHVDTRTFAGAFLIGLAMFATLFLGAVAVCVPYVLAVYFASLLITGLTGHWWPGQIAWPGLELAFAVVIVIALSLLGSVVLSATANGIAVFMLFGAGLVAGLLGTIGHALNSHAVKQASTVTAWALPFEALYQDGLRLITQNASGLTGFLLQLGPFGGAYVHGFGIRIWAVGYLVAVCAAAVAAFSRRNL